MVDSVKRVWWKKKRWWAAGVVLSSAMLAACSPADDTNSSIEKKLAEAEKPCPPFSEEEIVDVAIQNLVNLGTTIDKEIGQMKDSDRCPVLGQKPPCSNPLPYFSVAEFKEKNPDCCSILKFLPGDHPQTFWPNVRGEAFPKMYYVSRRITEKGKNSFVTSPVLIDCFGNMIREID